MATIFWFSVTFFFEKILILLNVVALSIEFALSTVFYSALGSILISFGAKDFFDS